MYQKKILINKQLLYLLVGGVHTIIIHINTPRLITHQDQTPCNNTAHETRTKKTIALHSVEKQDCAYVK